MPTAVRPVPRRSKRRKKQTPQSHVVSAAHDESVLMRREMVRKLTIEHDRIDVFAEHTVGGDAPSWFHHEMMEFQQANPEGMILAFPGARKSQYCTVARALFEIIRNPNIRILFVSDATEQAKTFLRGVKSHFEHNEELRETFGDFYTNAPKWTDGEIIVNRRTAVGMRESTITCAGMETALIGRHFDIILVDDLVTEENSSTEHQRRRSRNYFQRTLLTRLQPNGKMWVIGQRWHEEDLYGFLQEGFYKDSTFIFGVLDVETDQSVWESRTEIDKATGAAREVSMFPTARMHRYRDANLAGFELQWMCRHGVSVGDIFEESHFRYYDELPGSYFKWQGVDLAAGQKARNDFFSHVTIAVEKQVRDIYLIEFHERKLKFPAQVRFIDRRFRDHPDTVRVGAEANAYQIALTQQVREDYPDIPIVPRWTMKDKVARAQQLATIASDKPFFVRRQHGKFIRRMCSFPHGPKDVFDAFDLAVGMGLRGVKKRRGKEPGLI